MVEYNWMALALWALAFAIMFFGVTLPLVGFIGRISWNFVDECDTTPNLFFRLVYKQRTKAELDKAYEAKVAKAKADDPSATRTKGYMIIPHVNGYLIYHIPTGLHYDRSDGKFWTTKYSSGIFDTKAEAQRVIDTVPVGRLDSSHHSNSTVIKRESEKDTFDWIIGHLARVIGIVSILGFLGLLINHLLYPTLLIGSIVATVFGMRSLRRVQKKTVEVLADLKAHKNMSAGEAHKSSEQ
jgi:hypothetical protein